MEAYRVITYQITIHHTGSMSEAEVEAPSDMAPKEQKNYLGFDFSTQQVSHDKP